MKRLQDVIGSFGVLERDENIQTAVMRLAKDEESGPYGNEHPVSIQVLLVICGELDGTIGGDTTRLKAGDSVIVPRGVSHRFVRASDEPAIVFNVYSPPAY